MAVALSLFGAAAGWAVLAAGTVGYNVHDELHGSNPALSDGPDRGLKGIGLATWLVAYLIIGIFVFIFIGGYFMRIRPRLHTSKKSADRHTTDKSLV